MLIAIVTVFFLSYRKTKSLGYTVYDLLIVGGFALLLGLPFGSLLYTIVTYDLSEIIENIMICNFKVFGGIVFYGALIGGICGAFIGIKIAKLEINNVEKIIVPFIPIGHAIGRIGCVLAGCCYGIKHEGPFAVYYTNSVAGAISSQGYFPVQILEALLNLFVSLILLIVSKRTNKNFTLLSHYFILYGIVRFCIEFLRGDLIRGIYFEISTSQWISVSLILGSAIYLLVNKINQRNHKLNTNNKSLL